MNVPGFARRQPLLFSLLLLLTLFLVNGTAVTVSQIRNVPLTSVVVYSELVMAVLLVLIVSKMGWWREIGFRKPERSGTMWLYVPALLLPVGNLTFGVDVTGGDALLSFAVLAALSGFVEEVIFRGLMLRAWTARGETAALGVTTAIFGIAHAGNVLAGSDPLYVLLQAAYSLAIGFGFGAMALRGGLIWPLVLAHGLGNFVALINSEHYAVGHLSMVVMVYIAVFVGHGIYLLRSSGQTAQRALS